MGVIGAETPLGEALLGFLVISWPFMQPVRPFWTELSPTR